MTSDCLIFGLMLKVNNKHITRSSGVFFSNWSSLEFYMELSTEFSVLIHEIFTFGQTAFIE